MLHLDATDLPVGDRLTTWIDESGAGNDATQTDVDLKPHVIEQDGLPAVDFDGENDNLGLPPGFADFTSGYTAQVAARMEVVGSCVQILQMSNGQEIDDIGLWTVNGFGYEVGDLWVEGGGMPAPLGISVVFSVRQDEQGNVTVRQNGDDVAQGIIPLPANLPRAFNFVGGGLYAGCTQMAGSLQEILVWRRALDEGEMQQVTDVLVAKWNVL